MKISKLLLFASYMGFLATFVVHGQNQTGFISLDCGLPHEAEYFDEITGIYYSSDASFIDSGVNNTILPSLKSDSVDQQFHALRAFPQGTRNCYTLLPTRGKGNKYLIRARFMYGNYDGKGQLPKFDLHLGVEFWDTVTLFGASIPVSREIIHVASSNYIHVCLVNTGRGTPFISALELRPLNNSMYETTGSLNLITRLDMGLTGPQVIRYKDDIYDRLWEPNGLTDCTNCSALSTTSKIDPLSSNAFVPPSAVMETALSVSENSSEPFTINWETDNSTDQYYLCFHFAEVEFFLLDTREFNIYVNDRLWWGAYQPPYLGSESLYGRTIPTHSTFKVLMNMTENSTFPPLINAMEIYSIKELFHPQTHENDVAAILKVKAMYGVIRDWQGDPCAPKSYKWSGLDCKDDGSNPPRIISMNMSSSGLNGLIAPYITNLTKLESLDLSYNNLTGEVPDFLAGLASLRVLNLKGNNFTGSIPANLLSRSRKGLISLSADEYILGQKESCESTSCKKKTSRKFLVPMVATMAALLVLILAACVIFWFMRRKKGKVIGLEVQTSKIDGSLEMKNRQFTFLEVQSMTDNFQRVVGKGGFGTVYHGNVQGAQVAVKMLSPSSSQGYKEFQAETNILINVHHKNLTSLVGYCNEGTHIGLIYEYMANGSLESHLSDKNPYVLSWRKRLKIATDAAQGLEYLHSGCKPAIVHRDVKTTNILLHEDFQAKLSDFGLSRVFPVEGETHISTVVAGTPGYLDPEYYTTNRLTEKSDVYSFGVILLEMITSRPPIMRHQNETTHITNWVSSMLANGDVKKIVDPRFCGDFDVNSVWKSVELAMVCVSRTSSERPAMNYVVTELKECLAVQMDRYETGQDDSIGEIPTSLDSGLGPLAR